VINAWGFTYKTVGFYWAKLNKRVTGPPYADSDFFTGLGFWTRAGPELCLLATRGHPHRRHADVRKLIVSPRREHSRKPDEAYGRIERLCAGPYLEIFASSTAPARPNWTRWVGKDHAPVRRWLSGGYPQAHQNEKGG
jgi:N6-adenosine-specific RNA methylase IME4